MTSKALARRIGQSVLVLFITFTVAFFLLSALPSDGVMARYGAPALGLSQAEIAGIREEMGIDKPILVQFLSTLGRFLTGNFGTSVQTGTSVSTMVAENLPHTLALASTSVGLAVILALIIAYLATVPGLGFIGTFFRSLPSLLVSLPGFWLAILLLQFFSFRLGWVSAINPGPIEGLILPTLTLVVPMAAPLIQVLIRSIDEVNQLSFVQVVRAKGASEAWIFWRNVLRNAVLPALTMVGLLFGELVGGAVVTETVFGRAGLGNMTVQAVSNRDTPVLLAVVVIAATVYITINLIVDLLYPVLDVRLRRKVK